MSYPFKAGDSAGSSTEVADIFRRYGPEYKKKHKLPTSTHTLIRDIVECRTIHMGGRFLECDDCGHRHIAYNSCGNRHCPKCQALTKVRWLRARKADLLPKGYFHNVFTLPHELNPLVLRNKKVLLNLLFQTVNRTLQTFAADPKHKLCAQLGFIGVLHTWTQKLNLHYHLHCLIPAGAWDADRSRWVDADRKFLFPVKALSRVFRGKFLEALRKLYLEEKLVLEGAVEDLDSRKSFNRLLDSLYRKEWVAYSKKPFKSPEFVLDYLGRYTHRVAISNDRILDLRDGNVSFAYKNRDEGYRTEIETIPAETFIARFLLHELPGGFCRIRHFGFLCNRLKKECLERIRSFLGVEKPDELPTPTTMELIMELVGADAFLCPVCGKGRLIVKFEFDRSGIPTTTPIKVEVMNSA